MSRDAPLTRFICDLIEATPERLRAMDTAKAAAHYGLSEEVVRGYRDLQIGRPAQRDLFAA